MAQSEKYSKIDESEAPEGFYAISKDSNNSNGCKNCDARTLCQENKEDWCLINRCMAYEIVAFKDGKTYKRNDGQSVIFKLLPKI